MEQQQPSKRSQSSGRRPLSASSIFFFGLAAVLAVLAVLLATGTVRIGPSTPPPPPPTPGQIKVIDVVRALEAQGLAVQQTQQGVPLGELSAPGQGLTVDGEPLYLFIFTDPETAQRDVEAADPYAVLPASVMPEADRAEIPTSDPPPPMIVQGSNVAVAMPGGSDEQRAKVRAAIEGLP